MILILQHIRKYVFEYHILSKSQLCYEFAYSKKNLE